MRLPAAFKTLRLRLLQPSVLVIAFSALMCTVVSGVVLWKSLTQRQLILDRSKTDIQNLTHSLAEHATTTVKTVDVIMGGVVDLMRYREPDAARMSLYLANAAKGAPQVRELGVLDTSGNWKYSSLKELPKHSNSDRSYFIHHRDHDDPGIFISEPVRSRVTDRMTVVLSRRIVNQAGEFTGVLIAAIDSDFFFNFYEHFHLGPDAGIALVRTDAVVIVHWPSRNSGTDISGTTLFTTNLKASPTGFDETVSPFDGVAKYYGYEQSSSYPLIVTVAQSKNTILSAWRRDLLSDLAVAAFLLLTVLVLGLILAEQLRQRQRAVAELRQREHRYRLLADNVADIVLLLDRRGVIQFVSQSVTAALGYEIEDLVGRSCLDVVHPDDVDNVKAASQKLFDSSDVQNVVFRTRRADGGDCWTEYNFKFSGADENGRDAIVGVLRDVTHRKSIEDELIAANRALARLAAVDGLTGLANRRAFDEYLYNDCRLHRLASVVMIDIDHFKGLNDSLGHQAGDQALKQVAEVVLAATAGTTALAARYGGEEFILVLPGVNERGARMVAESIRLQVRNLAIANPRAERGVLSVSAGVSCGSPRDSDPSQLVTDADFALYEAKSLGRDRTVVGAFRPEGVSVAVA